MCNYVQLCATMCNYVQLCTTHMWAAMRNTLCATMCNYVQHIMCNCVQLSATHMWAAMRNIFLVANGHDSFFNTWHDWIWSEFRNVSRYVQHITCNYVQLSATHYVQLRATTCNYVQHIMCNYVQSCATRCNTHVSRYAQHPPCMCVLFVCVCVYCMYVADGLWQKR